MKDRRETKVETTIVAGSTAANKDGCGSERRKIGRWGLEWMVAGITGLRGESLQPLTPSLCRWSSNHSYHHLRITAPTPTIIRFPRLRSQSRFFPMGIFLRIVPSRPRIDYFTPNSGRLHETVRSRAILEDFRSEGSFE